MKKAKKNVFYFIGKLLIIVSVLLFLCASGSAQNNYWSGFGFSGFSLPPMGIYQGYASSTKTDPFSTIPGSITKDNSSSTGSRSGSSSSSSGLNQNPYYASGWTDTMTWYMDALDIYGWKPGNMIGGMTSTTCYFCNSSTFSTCGFNCGGNGITSATCVASSCYAMANYYSTRPKDTEKFYVLNNLYETMSTCNLGCHVYVEPYPLPGGGSFFSSDYSYSSSSYIPSSPPAW